MHPTKRTPFTPKGPDRLPDDAITEIVQRRFERGVIDKLATKFNCSTTRIYTVWKQYYGGKTLNDARGGLIRPLPGTEHSPAPEDPVLDGAPCEKPSAGGTRTVNSPKYKLTANAPPVRAKVSRKVVPQKQPLTRQQPCLDIEMLPAQAPGSDAQAELVAGAIEAGNDNDELIDAMYQLMEQNTQLSQQAITALKHAEKFYKQNKKKRSLQEYTTTDDERPQNQNQRNDGYDSTKCSSAIDDRTDSDQDRWDDVNPQLPERADRADERDWQDYEPDQRRSRVAMEQRHFPAENRDNRQNSGGSQGPVQSNFHNSGNPVVRRYVDGGGAEQPGRGNRAQPVHRFGNTGEPERANTPETSNSGAKVSVLERIPSQRTLQYYPALYRYKLGD
jgi:hypothetical protein